MSRTMNPASRRLSAVLLTAMVMAVIAHSQPLAATSGYWKYDSQQITPTNEYYASIKASPGRVYEVRATGGLQAGPGSGKGSIDSFFKTDNPDRVQFLATSTLTFGANASLVTLVPLQKVVFDLSLTVGGNDTARALPATGRGGVSIDFGDSCVEVTAKLGQTASAKGTATIPGGGPGGTMVIGVSSALAQLGQMNPILHIRYVWVEGTPPPASKTSRFAGTLGNTLTVREVAGANVYDGTWTRREGTDIFDAVWTVGVRDVIEVESVNGNQIVLYRRGNSGRYSGTLSADGKQVTSGTANWYAPGWFWSATVR